MDEAHRLTHESFDKDELPPPLFQTPGHQKRCETSDPSGVRVAWVGITDGENDEDKVEVSAPGVLGASEYESSDGKDELYILNL